MGPESAVSVGRLHSAPTCGGCNQTVSSRERWHLVGCDSWVEFVAALSAWRDEKISGSSNVGQMSFCDAVLVPQWGSKKQLHGFGNGDSIAPGAGILNGNVGTVIIRLGSGAFGVGSQRETRR